MITHKQDRDICYSMYSPKSVVEAMLRHKFGTYWNQTETYEALKVYIQMNMDGEAVAKGAINQMKEKQYIDALKDYEGNLLLAGINYDRETKKHTCMIEKMNIS